MAQKRRARKPITLDELRGTMTTALLELERIFQDSGNDVDQRIRAINSLATLSNSYVRITEVSDLEERLTALESQTHLKRAI
jgi:hypothetical protein